MALANTAVLLAQRGLRVLVIDWDLEAPGLDNYFAALESQPSKSGGLFDLLTAATRAPQIPDWRDYTGQITVSAGVEMSILRSGSHREGYEAGVLKFDWDSFFAKSEGGAFLERLRDEWLINFDVTFIDSRTGITDAGGVCTIQMPDVLVSVFSTNHQSLAGSKRVATHARNARQNLAYDRSRLLVFPLLSRFDGRTEFKQSQQWLTRCAKEWEEVYRDWLPKGTTPLQAVEKTKVPYVPYFSFGENLPVLTEGTSDPEGVGYAYSTIAQLLASDFRLAGEILASQTTPTVDVPRLLGTMRHRIAPAESAASLSSAPSFFLSAIPITLVDVPGLVESSSSDVVKLLEAPPSFRRGGFEIRINEKSKLMPGGRARRVSKPGWQLLEAWRDGCILFVASGERFLAHDIHSGPGDPLFINTLALTESAYVFCDLARQFWQYAQPTPDRVQYMIGFHNLLRNNRKPILVPEEVSEYPLRSFERYEAPAEDAEFELERRVDSWEAPPVAAFQLIAEIYVWFGIEIDRIPYTTQSDVGRVIDVARLQRLK
jgi:MinD-like ATPase involved in chromosome partitioning or flagellar assembly